MSTVLVPIEENTLALVLRARLNESESIDGAILRRFAGPPSAPSLPARQVSADPQRLPIHAKYKAVLLGEEIGASSLGRLLAAVISRLAELDEGILERLAGRGGRTRPVVARCREELYPGSEHLIKSALALPGGWWVGTNYSRRDAQRILRVICAAAGLTYGADLKVSFR